VTVGGLTAGKDYNLYEYDFSDIAGVGDEAAINVPTRDFNASSALATHVTHFRASGVTYSHTVTRTSDQIVIFRAVPADAP